jgi:excinuclease ABC subunit A
VIDLGPEAGDGGGSLVYAGPPSGLRDIRNSFTGKFL